jgi:hypothetical protein
MLVAAELSSRLIKKAVLADPTLANDPLRLAEMSRQAMRSPETLLRDDEDRAFAALDKAVRRGREEIDDELDALYYDGEDGARRPTGERRLGKTHALLARCIKLDEHCYDAHTLDALVCCECPDEALERLDALEPEARAWCAAQAERYDDPVVDPWDSVFLRPWLRMRSRAVDLLVQMSCYREALARCEAMLDEAPGDAQGMRHTTALLYARLEEEQGLLDLDARFAHQGSCWMHVARSVLLYKLGRMDAARRALVGLADLCPGAAYYLAYPSYVPPYLPDRPVYAPGTDQESLLATFEADFLVVDTPDFVNWALSVERFSRAAEAFGATHGGY